MLSPRVKSCVLLLIPMMTLISICLSPALAAGGGHEDTGDLEHQVNTESLTGINLMLADLYNDNRLMFAVAVTATMAVLGAIIAIGTEYVLKLAGFTTTKADHRE